MTTGICIVFDRLRSEEKMLKAEAESLGCQAHMLDAKTVTLSTDSITPGGISQVQGDVILERCVSYFRGLHMTAALESASYIVINSHSVAATCGNKMVMTLRLKSGGVIIPETHFAFSPESAEQILEGDSKSGEGYPLVIKPVIGSWGRGVMPIRDSDTLNAVLEARSVTDGPFDRIFYLQKMIEKPPHLECRRDIRVITVGDMPIAAMYRNATGDGFRANVAVGGDPEPCKITPQMEEMAIQASRAVGGGILGVDMMETSDGLVVHEVNNTVEFKGISRVSENNIPKAMIQYAIDTIRK